MLKQISCDLFRTKTINFNKHLNVVLSCWRFEYFRDVVLAYTYDGVYAIDNLQGLLIF